MRSTIGRLVAAGGWLAFPVIPLLAEDLYYRLGNLNFAPQARSGPDPYDWGAAQWALMLGPLLGYGFLAGATWGVADEPGGRRWWRWAHRRAAWVGLGPWLGFWAGAAIGLALYGIDRALNAAGLGGWLPTVTLGPTVDWWASLAAGAWVAFGWLLVARAALRRAARAGRRGSAWRNGLIGAAAFVGSLLGTYWAITAAGRGYYFDPTMVP